MTTSDAPEQGRKGNSDASAANSERGWLTRKLAGFYRGRDTIKAHPLWGTLFFFTSVIAGVAGHESYDYIKRQLVGPDEYLVQMRNEQKQAFAKLQENLGKLSGSIDHGNRQALDDVQGAVKALESTNSSLLDQLAMAKHENDSLRRIAEQKTGPSGGYDFILTVDNGIRIDPNTILGLRYVSGANVGVSLTSLGADTQSVDLRSGQSIAYNNASGKACKVALLGLDYTVKSASFAVSCAHA